MPEIEINGEKKKVACGPCIRGHRSSKCTHKDRVLIEVRKPGRPLSACPHPAGSCSCERMVVNYTLPKTQQCSCAPSSGSSSGSTSGRVQKGKAKRPTSSIKPTSLQRAFSADSSIVQETSNGDHEVPLTQDTQKRSCCGGATEAEATTVTTAQSAESKTPDTDSADPVADDPPKLRLGMFGIGGYRATDQIGWSEPYPDMYNVPYEHNGVSRHLTTSSGDSRTPASMTESMTPASCCNTQTDTSINSSSPEAGAAVQPQGLTSQQQHNNQGAPVNGRYPQNGFAGTAHLHHIAQPASTSSAHNCSCGEGCACLACLTHPYNKTTLDYVRYHTDLSMRHDEGAFVTNGQNQLSSFRVGLKDGQTHSSRNGAGIIEHADRSSSFDMGNGHNHLSGNDVGLNGLAPWVEHRSASKDIPNGASPWHPNVLPQATPTQELENLQVKSYSTAPDMIDMTAAGAPTPETNGHSSSQVPSTPTVDFSRMEGSSAFDPNSPQQNEDSSTLSPSSFFLQSYTLPGCDDASGTCQCGDGCICPGCLTHTGHQALEQHPAEPNSRTLHGAGCACPHPALEQSSNSGPPSIQSAGRPQIPTSYLDQHQAAASPPFSSPNGMNGMPVSTFTHIHGPNCACPVDSAVLQAQAQVQAHAQLHGPHCRCPTGVVFLNAQLQAEARLHNQLHGTSANGWVVGAPG